MNMRRTFTYRHCGSADMRASAPHADPELLAAEITYRVDPSRVQDVLIALRDRELAAGPSVGLVFSAENAQHLGVGRRVLNAQLVIGPGIHAGHVAHWRDVFGQPSQVVEDMEVRIVDRGVRTGVAVGW